MPTLVKDRFAEKTTLHIQSLAQKSDAVRRMYYFDAKHENIPADRDADLFREKEMSPVKGLIYKYPGRVLILLSYTCAANCRYCERQDRVGVGLDEQGRLTPGEIGKAVQFVAEHSEISEVIFSGGDPLTHPHGLLSISEQMAALQHIRILRIHTRYPIQLPEKVDFALLGKLSHLPPTFYCSLHIDHPDELTPDVEDVITRIRKLGFVLLCQSVFLKGINDDVDVLARLFTRLAELGVRPYYIYHCHPIATTMRFVMALDDEIAIISRLRETISGVACPQHIFELRHTIGKLVVPNDHWNVNLGQVRNFVGTIHDVESMALCIEPHSSQLVQIENGHQSD